MIEAIQQAWAWTGLDPAEVIAVNAFGNVIVRDPEHRFWRICPEELSCEPIAESPTQFEAVMGDEDFNFDWEMSRLVETARETLGELEPNRCYCLKLPAALGGEYSAGNLGTVSVDELVAFAGDVAFQIKELPDGANVDIKLIGGSPGGSDER